MMHLNKSFLENLYATYNHREFVHPDPLEFIYHYNNPLDREVVGLIASSFAYGNVKQILRSISFILDKMGSSPTFYLQTASKKDLQETFPLFYHRWHTAEDLVVLLWGLKRILQEYGSLYDCFKEGFSPNDTTLMPPLSLFIKKLSEAGGKRVLNILPLPERGSAVKRLNMYLRWMVRKDAVDPGLWEDIPESKLVVPMDTHMHQLCYRLKITQRKQANLNTAFEVTDFFRKLIPEDPVKYDFALTRLGIRRESPKQNRGRDG